jgi:hypothetical protein
MAIIFNISEAIKSSEFNVLGLSIPMLLENQVEEFEKGSKIGKLFVNKTLSGYSQSYHTSVSHGGFRPSEDMEIAKLHDWEDSYGKTFTAQTWKDSFAISQEAREDNKDLEIEGKVRDFSTNYARTREQYCAATAAGALAGSYTYGGKKFSAKAIDTVDGEIDGQKQLYFHKHHFTSVKVADANDFIFTIDFRHPFVAFYFDRDRRGCHAPSINGVIDFFNSTAIWRVDISTHKASSFCDKLPYAHIITFSNNRSGRGTDVLTERNYCLLR